MSLEFVENQAWLFASPTVLPGCMNHDTGGTTYVHHNHPAVCFSLFFPNEFLASRQEQQRSFALQMNLLYHEVEREKEKEEVERIQ